MREPEVHLTGVERTVGTEEVIVTKTDPRGRITYANDVFLRVAGYAEHEVIGRPHNIVRHPAMPRCVFKLLWDSIKGGQEIFAYVLNRASNGDHYWVFAHVTPSHDDAGRLIGYHSNRRSPAPEPIRTISGVYESLLAEEARHDHPTAAMAAGHALLADTLEQAGVSYEQFVWSLAADRVHG